MVKKGKKMFLNKKNATEVWKGFLMLSLKKKKTLRNCVIIP